MEPARDVATADDVLEAAEAAAPTNVAAQAPSASPPAAGRPTVPFEPPAGVGTGPEFEAEPPRPLPDFLAQVPHGRRSRRTAVLTLVLGALCLVYGESPPVHELSYYILPLGYLRWVGWALLTISGASAVSRMLGLGRFAYIRKGIALPARVLQVRTYRRPGGLPSFGFEALVELRHPETGRVEERSVRSPVIDQEARFGHYSTTLKAGDWVTAVALPGRFEQSLALYGFLGLHPEQDFIRKDGKPLRVMPAVEAALLAACLVAVLTLAIGALYVASFMEPIRMGIIAGVASAAGGVAALVAFLLLRGTMQSAVEGKRGRLVIAGVGFVLLGTIAGFLGAAVINAVFDRSPGETHDIKVVRCWQVTHKGIFRSYEIEFVELGGGPRRKVASTPGTMDKFALGYGVVDVGAGALGMEWVRAIHPAVLVPLEPGETRERAVAAGELHGPGGEVKQVVLRAAIDLGHGTLAEASPALLERIRHIGENK